MSPLTSIGEMRFSEAHEGGRDYFFKPSFAAMNAVGSPDEIVSIFSLIHGANVQEALNRISLAKVSLPSHMMKATFQRLSEEILAAAMHVMQCCYTGDYDLKPLIGEWKGWKHCIVYRPGALSKGAIIAIAQGLMQHGVIGKAKIRRLQRNESNAYARDFEVSDYIIAARNHFGMSRDDAASLTMTEFTLLLSAKYPEQKGLTKDEYEAVADAHLARQAARRAKTKQR